MLLTRYCPLDILFFSFFESCFTGSKVTSPSFNSSKNLIFKNVANTYLVIYHWLDHLLYWGGEKGGVANGSLPRCAR